MARPRHWLDPLARRLLQASGELPSPPKPPKPIEPLVLDTPAVNTWQIDVNRASQSDWLKLPGCSSDQADLLVRLQRGGVQFSGADDLSRLLELGSEQLALWLPHLLFRWYSEPPNPAVTAVDLNNASNLQLQALGLSPERQQRLMRERSRQAFRDIADLQERLLLPAAVIEKLIGKVCFGPASSGPELPLARP
jgi:DNA uptake protein ComE-like DNA-binding protein